VVTARGCPSYRQEVTLLVALALAALLCAGCYGLGWLCGKRGEPTRDRIETRWRARGGRDVPPVRALEDVVADVRRLGLRFHGLHPHASFAKAEAVRAAYDRALTECCANLSITHLLGVLPVGPERDAERERVEGLIGDSGVRLPYAA
jgi:hypothetical protein